MAFSLTSKQVELRGSWLVAAVRKGDGSWTEARLDLNDYLGNNDGAFDVAMNKWYDSALDWSCHLRGTVLCAQLRNIAGEFASETSINLDLFIRNRDGILEFQNLGDSLFLYTASLTLDNAKLRGLVVGRDGKFHTSTIDLDDYYGNINGRFEANERHFSRSGRNFGLEHDIHALRLTGDVMDYAGEHHHSEIDISECVVNSKGHLAFNKPDETAERDQDHWATTIAEPIPLVGSAVASLQQSRKEDEVEDRFYRQIASQTNSAHTTISVVIGAFIGRAAKSPIIGMVIGAGLNNSPNVFTDPITNSIEDAEIRGQIQELKLGIFVLETLRDLIAVDDAVSAASLLTAALNPEIDNWTKGFSAWLERQSINPLPEFSLHTMLKRVYIRLQGESVEEWDKVLELLTDTQQRIETLQLEPEPEPEPEVEPTPEPEPEPLVSEVSKTDEPTTGELAATEASATSPLTNGILPNGDSAPKPEQQQSTTDESSKPAAVPAAPADVPNGTTPASKTATTTTNTSSPSSSNPKLAASTSKNGSTRGSTRKGWHNVLGVSLFRGWSKHRQPKAI
ncbi:Cyanovirin-N [Hypoxylon trugodes]|uniref:Cyanovirin-N n=1 Tax=Hypoxylon trugodes TaxID=326681 RepID=UPI00219967C8|nr:Cyanovirin-N [Hypoxylon trugodes]KAI1385973.1 Cyanovirin-N [Hypoxylon trugodes]